MDDRSLHLLYLEADEQDAVLFQEALLGCLPDFSRPVTLQVERTGEATLTAIENRRPNLIFLDFQRPTPEDWDVLRALKVNTHTAAIPVIVLAPHDASQVRDRAFAMHANGCVIKSVDPRELTPRLKGTLSFWASPHVRLPES
ncbi:response regulator [Deinococcus yavapaiensis]|uniref:Response regulator receiver domain-containing protein n=1 Tax=Deinococcus yavapaiensis KR-236 TaxID=694435 RepID=A0A318S624_9DEIO|nr:response regulator [Deinococcus yavapaiensis]PYE54113.1 response regulator receiver domain-containing protein [Deinococcus yavapaiensis KR-236]